MTAQHVKKGGSVLTVSDLLRQNRRPSLDQHSRNSRTDVLLRLSGSLAAYEDLARSGVSVRRVAFDRVECAQCDTDPAPLTSVIVYGQPDPMAPEFNPVGYVEVCIDCAPTVIEEALATKDPKSTEDIQVEVHPL